MDHSIDHRKNISKAPRIVVKAAAATEAGLVVDMTLPLDFGIESRMYDARNS